MVTGIVLIVIAAAGVILGLAMRRPDAFTYTRSRMIKAPPETIFAFVNDFREWQKWSPWEKLDPAMTRSYGPETVGVGAHYGWEGKKAGAGTMDIEQSEPSSHIHIRLEFLKPFKASNKADFRFSPAGESTQVVWTMTGNSPFPAKIMGLFMDFEKMIGKDFEKGLENLAQLTEG